MTQTTRVRKAPPQGKAAPRGAAKGSGKGVEQPSSLLWDLLKDHEAEFDSSSEYETLEDVLRPLVADTESQLELGEGNPPEEVVLFVRAETGYLMSFLSKNEADPLRLLGLLQLAQAQVREAIEQRERGEAAEEGTYAHRVQ
jgi:hypothetical protein